MRNYTYILFFVSICLQPIFSYATTLYKWVDEAGQTHFTDNPINIPMSQKTFEKREMQSVNQAPQQTTKKVSDIILGRQIWQNTCSQCHYMGEQPHDATLRSLPSSIVQKNTDIESIAKRLKKGLTLRAVDMNDIKLSDTEIRAVAAYIQQRIDRQ